jgi:hypothetical protein
MWHRLYMGVVNYGAAWLNVSKDINERRNPAHVPLPPSKSPPYSTVEALLMFDILQRQSDSLWGHITRLEPKRARERNYRYLEVRCTERLMHLTIQMRYLARARNLLAEDQPETEALDLEIVHRWDTIEPNRVAAHELQEKLHGERFGRKNTAP